MRVFRQSKRVFFLHIDLLRVKVPMAKNLGLAANPSWASFHVKVDPNLTVELVTATASQID